MLKNLIVCTPHPDCLALIVYPLGRYRFLLPIVYPLGYTIGNRNLEADILDTEADILDASSRPKLVCWKVPLSGFVYILISPALENLRKS